MKNKKMKLWGIIVSFSIIFSIIFSYTNIIKANEENVTNFQELKRAIESNSSVNITSSFDIPEMITIPSSYTGTIKGNNNTLTIGATIDNMFYLKGANVTFENVILDGAEKGRLMNISGGTVNIVNSKLTKGTTRYYEPKLRDTRDEQNYQGGALFVNGANVNLENTIFENNYTKEDTPRNAATPDGGALYAGSRSTINVVGGKFIGNHTGGPTALGGAVMIEDSSVININSEIDTQKDKTIFEKNHSISTGLNNHGGTLQIKNSTANIYATTFNVYKPFEIGGAIHFHSANNAVVKNSKFIIDNLGDAYAISGGAIASYDSNLEVDNSEFVALGTSKVTFAGGFIDIVEGGKFHLTNSTLTGQGQGNGKELASFGGAIAFETGSSTKSWINNVTISNVSSSETGGAIAIGTRKGEERYDYGEGNFGPYSNQSITITNSTIENTQTLFWGRQPGGAIYVGPRNSALVYNTKITNSKAGIGGSIYNMGTVTLDGGTSINGSYAMFAGASIFNDGKLILGNSSVNASFTGDAHWNGNYTKYKNPVEYPGINIYAKKDIIVTPDASFNDKDIKVLDGVSSIVLTNNIDKKINVSISENVGPNNEDKELYETNRRYIGYTVARGIKPTDLENIPETNYPGTGNVKFIPDGLPNEYKVRNTDAQFLHYVTKDQNQATSPYEDHSSLGQWDYVLNPEDNSIVLGQRVKMVYHTNEDGATIEGGSEDTGHVGQKLDQVYTVYKSGGGKAKVSVENKPVKEITPVDKVPALEGYKFKSWNKDLVKGKAKYDINKLEDKYDFNSNDNTFTKGTTSEITSIINPAILHT